MPLLRDLACSGGYKSVVSHKQYQQNQNQFMNHRKPTGVLSDFNVTAGSFSRQNHEDGAPLILQPDNHDDELNRSQV